MSEKSTNGPPDRNIDSIKGSGEFREGADMLAIGPPDPVDGPVLLPVDMAPSPSVNQPPADDGGHTEQ